MTGEPGGLGYTLSIVLLVAGVLIMYAAAVALWRPAPGPAARWLPLSLMGVGFVVIVAGLALR